MSKKANKISELEKLKLRKEELHGKLDLCTQSINNHIDYFQQNLGSLVVNTIASGISSKIESAMQYFLLFIGREKKAEPDTAGNTAGINQPRITLILERIISLIPLIFRITRPLIVRFLLRKLRSWFRK